MSSYLSICPRPCDFIGVNITCMVGSCNTLWVLLDGQGIQRTGVLEWRGSGETGTEEMGRLDGALRSRQGKKGMGLEGPAEKAAALGRIPFSQESTRSGKGVGK